ncbi:MULTISPECIES: FliM/FliN family flagellar motor switch protein [Pseudomonas]|uniref:FliM/FliN family flagellar motor switch protein n=1 Tax=Pseudomonas TaxID=286 RepID=UPI001BEAE601|nr:MULTISPECIES: FliM/FliN family flagellar motor switch protein [Pseudomonas]MBT2339711.1 FliM/FliN family flagellar motor switch protein [Pseudomonas fluorescens]MCD4531233.1 FliM/FliN family flagellar motor switch protein [Pseudomonas sp. C3-2018]
MRALKLRRVDSRSHAHTQAIQRWQRAGRQAGLGKVPEKTGYVGFRAESNGADWHGLISAREWLQLSLPTLQALLGRECPLSSIVALFRAVPRPLPPDAGELHYNSLSGIECVEPSHLPTHAVPWLETERGRVWVTQLTPLGAVDQPLAPDSWLDTLPLRLVLRLGVSHLSLASRMRLSEGDVLRITEWAQHCVIANRCLGFFTFTEEGLHMQPTEAALENLQAPGAKIDLGGLPVRLEFVLATHEVDLVTLSQIVDGQLIPLADDAARNIEVRANGKPIALGELVQLDEQLGVELLKVYRSSGDE